MMPTVDSVANLDQLFRSATDPGFRARSVTEYERIRAWVRNDLDLDRCRILDFGCGSGYTAASFAARHPTAQVFGYDIEPVSVVSLERTLKAQAGLKLPSNLTLMQLQGGGLPSEAEFDLVFAWSVFEHVRRDWLADILAALHGRIKLDGLLFVLSEPLYFSPRGSHLHRFYTDAWQHLTISLDALREGVLAAKADESELRAWQIFAELNRMTADDLLETVGRAGFRLKREQRFRTDLVPGEALLRTYNADALTTVGVQALFTKAPSAS